MDVDRFHVRETNQMLCLRLFKRFGWIFELAVDFSMRFVFIRRSTQLTQSQKKRYVSLSIGQSLYLFLSLVFSNRINERESINLLGTDRWNFSAIMILKFKKAIRVNWFPRKFPTKNPYRFRSVNFFKTNVPTHVFVKLQTLADKVFRHAVYAAMKRSIELILIISNQITFECTLRESLKNAEVRSVFNSCLH